MKIIDISMPIHEEMPVYKDRKEKSPEIKIISDHQQGEVRETEIKMNLHTGTHFDAPLHMVAGAETMETYSLDKFITPCRVLDLTEKDEKITARDLKEQEINEDEFILFKTRNSFADNFTTDFVYLEQTGAEFLAEKQIKGVGTDSLGIERAQPDHKTHKTLLSREIIILEGLRLKEVAAGAYKLLALPLRIANVEAAPARAFLLPD
ncbi:MAG: cyclase family protein [Bacillota bacterium]